MRRSSRESLNRWRTNPNKIVDHFGSPADGWAVENAIEDDELINAHQQLLEATAGGEGPLIYQGREEWQRELDTVCRKLNKFLASSC